MKKRGATHPACKRVNHSVACTSIGCCEISPSHLNVPRIRLDTHHLGVWKPGQEPPGSQSNVCAQI